MKKTHDSFGVHTNWLTDWLIKWCKFSPLITYWNFALKSNQKIKITCHQGMMYVYDPVVWPYNAFSCILRIIYFIHPSFIFRLFEIIKLLALFYWIALGLLLALVFWIVTIRQHGNEIFVVLVRATNEVEVGTGTPSTHDGKNRSISSIPIPPP